MWCEWLESALSRSSPFGSPASGFGAIPAIAPPALSNPERRLRCGRWSRSDHNARESSERIPAAKVHCSGRYIVQIERVAVQLLKVMPADREPEDRKSTRLNSSHRCISYAVFCLKKKI